jgi:hypothetical protein
MKVAKGIPQTKQETKTIYTQEQNGTNALAPADNKLNTAKKTSPEQAKNTGRNTHVNLLLTSFEMQSGPYLYSIYRANTLRPALGWQASNGGGSNPVVGKDLAPHARYGADSSPALSLGGKSSTVGPIPTGSSMDRRT